MMYDDYAYKVIADHYGYDHQQLKLIEECGELVQALAKNDTPNIIEEMADVANVMIQMVYLMGAGKLVDQIMGEKIDRQKERMMENVL